MPWRAGMSGFRNTWPGEDSWNGRWKATWANAPVSDRAEQWGTIGATFDTAEVAADGPYRAGLAPIEGRLTGENAGFTGNIALARPGGQTVEGVSGGAMPDLNVRQTEQPDLGGLNPSVALNLPEIDVDNPNLVPRANEVASNLNALRVSNPGLTTSPGPAPQIPLVGASDPAHIDRTGAAGREGVLRSAVAARESLIASE
jgi:hypothetical protein